MATLHGTVFEQVGRPDLAPINDIVYSTVDGLLGLNTNPVRQQFTDLGVTLVEETPSLATGTAKILAFVVDASGELDRQAAENAALNLLEGFFVLLVVVGEPSEAYRDWLDYLNNDGPHDEVIAVVIVDDDEDLGDVIKDELDRFVRFQIHRD